MYARSLFTPNLRLKKAVQGSESGSETLALGMVVKLKVSRGLGAMTGHRLIF